jgi:hypothetical protein
MSELRLDTADLDQLFKDLLSVSIAFTEIERVSASVAGAVGQSDLEKRVSDFSTKWDDRRVKIIESVDALWKASHAISKTFDDLDRQMADAMRKKD